MNALTKSEQNALAVSYDVLGSHVELDLDFVKRYLVRGRANLVSDQEIVFFMNTCKMQKMNPLTAGEIYLIKYSENDPAQIVVGKGAYMRRAFEHPDYLYKEDGIVIIGQDGNVIKKEGTCLYPGEKLLGGWCRVHFIRNGAERTAYKEVSFDEYNKGQANWKSKPSTMINKCAISQCVREAFPKDYEGLYSEEEMIASGAIPATYKEVNSETGEEIEVNTETGEAVEDIDKPASQEQKQEFLEEISKHFVDIDTKNEIFKLILSDLGLRGTSSMTIREVEQAIELVRKYAEEDGQDAEEYAEPETQK